MMTEETVETTEVVEPKPKAKAKPKKKQYEYFSEKELKCKHTGESGMDDKFMEVLIAIRKECDFPFPITSAYRHPTHPLEARKESTGAHSLGRAVDVAVRGEKALKLISVAQAHGITRIGVAQKGTSRFIHIDNCTEEDGFPSAIWSY